MLNIHAKLQFQSMINTVNLWYINIDYMLQVNDVFVPITLFFSRLRVEVMVISISYNLIISILILYESFTKMRYCKNQFTTLICFFFI